MEYYDDYEREEMPEFLEIIKETVENEIANRFTEIISDRNRYEKQRDDLKVEIIGLRKEMRDKESGYNLDMSKVEMLDSIIKNVRSENIESLISIMGIKKTLDVCRSDLATSTRLILEYYDDRELIFKLLDTCNIKYPDKIKGYKLPRYFNKEELLSALKSNKFYRTNGNYFGSNYENIFTDHPLQELFMNKNMLESDCLDFIISKLGESYFSDTCFYRIGNYVQIPNEYIDRMAQTIDYSKKLYDDRESFINKHKDYLFSQRWFYDLTFNNIDVENHYRTFYLSKYADAFIIDYLSKQSNPVGIFNKLRDMKDDRVNYILKELSKLL